MNFSQETVKEALVQAANSGLLKVDNLDAIAALVVSNCAQIEGEKIRAEYESRNGVQDRSEWSAAPAA